MRILKALGIVVLVIVAIPVLWFGSAWVFEAWDTHTHRFRLTLEVDTPDGVKSGSSVIEVKIWGKATWIPQTGGTLSKVRGEAVFVDLGSGRNFIAVLGFGPTGSQGALYNLAARAFGRDRPFWYREAPSWTGRAELTGDLVPTLVTFSDLNDPKSARVVRPNEFEQALGAGVRLRGARIEMTSDTVTRGIEKKLPWWKGPGRPASEARRAWLAGQTAGPSIEPETLFKRD